MSADDADARYLVSFKPANIMAAFKPQNATLAVKEFGTQIFALPIATAATPTTMSPFKTEPTILPKNLHVPNSPVILSTPQRVISSPQLLNSPRTPQHSLTPVVVDSSVSWSGKRPHELGDSDYPESKRIKKGEKGGKGLRHFSMKVCEKVQKKGTTSYNEVADELVAEFSDPQRHSNSTEQAYDQKNIRRRVYDALNVLMAMNIISKEKKEIKWLGLPTNSAQECQILEVEKTKRLDRMKMKTQQLYDLIIQQIAFKNLVERNKASEKQRTPLMPNSTIQLPFIIVNTSKKTVIDCSISNDKMEYLFNFDNTFEIHDDIEVLKRMGLTFNLDKGTCSPEDLEKARQMVAKSLEPYVVQMAQGGGDILSDVVGESSGLRSRQIGSYSNGSSLSPDPDTEVAMATSHTPGLSRQSSVGSLSDLPSRPGTSTPSDDFSDQDSEPSSLGE